MKKIFRSCLITILIILFVVNMQLVSASPSDSVNILMRAYGFPVVMTNESTNVEETTATLNGFLEYDGGSPCQYRFQYDVDSGVPYTISTPWTGSINAPQTFSQAISMLVEGELYYFRAQANNSGNISSGSEKRFLTKPDMPTNFQAVRNGIVTQIDLTWIKGVGAQKSIIVRKTGSYPVDRADGLVIYNGTSNNYNDGAVVSGTHYYYRIWSYVEESGLHQHSDNYDEDSVIALAPATFDIRDIVIRDNVVEDLGISVIVENRGGILVDITVSWTLKRTDNGNILDLGSDTFAVGPFSTYLYIITPSTSYVGSVIISFSGDGATATEMFVTQAPPSGGGGGFAPPPSKPPIAPGVPPVAYIAAPIETPCLIMIIISIVFFILLIIIYKREKEEKK